MPLTVIFAEPFLFSWKSRVRVLPDIEAETKSELLFAWADLEISSSLLSTSVKTELSAMAEFDASSLTVTSLIALETVGASSTAVTLTVTVAASESEVPSLTLKPKFP